MSKNYLPPCMQANLFCVDARMAQGNGQRPPSVGNAKEGVCWTWMTRMMLCDELLTYNKHMRKIFVLLSLFVAILATAAPVSRSAALKQARQFMQQHGVALRNASSSFRAPRMSKGAAATAASYYVFNNEGGGFVIISGDDRTATVLGYSTQGSLDESRLPSNVVAWLKGYADQIAWLDDNKVSVVQKAPAAGAVQMARHPIAPMVNTRWNQGDPYNQQCPIYFDSNGNAGQSVTGCVATAMAQVMAYHRYPDRTIAEIPAHSNRYPTPDSTRTVSLEPIASGTVIDWENMSDVYDSRSTEAQKNAVSQLMLLCGQSVKMGYGATSGALSEALVPALIKYFGYDEDLHIIYRSAYSISDWNTTMYNELVNNRPVCYSGASTGGAHEFVIDGYDGEDLFHVNWGWGGYCDGYFALSVLNPGSNTGIGASSTNDGYSMGQTALIGVQRPDGKSQPAPVTMTTNSLSVDGDTFCCDFWNVTGQTRVFDIGLAIRTADGSLTDCRTAYQTQSLDNYVGYPRVGMTFGDLADGIYHIVPISRVSGEEEWHCSVSDPELYFLVEVKDGVYTISVHQRTLNLGATFELEGLKIAGSAHTLLTTVVNRGDEYNGNFYLFASDSLSDVGTADYSRKGITSAGCPLAVGQSHVFQTPYTPSSAGTLYVWATTDDKGTNVIGQTSFEIGPGSVGSSVIFNGVIVNNQSDPTVTIGNRTVYGNRVAGNIMLSNGSTTVPYSGKIDVYMYHDGGDGYLYGSVLSSTTVTLPVSGSINLPFEFAGNTNATYWLLVKSNGSDVNDWRNSAFYLRPGFVRYKADGSCEASVATRSVTVPDDVVAVDLRGTAISIVVPNSNPNTLYYLDSGASVSGLDEANVVKDGAAEVLRLTDGHDFYVPSAFTAAEVTYSRVPQVLTDGESGWETLTVPFDVTSVTKDGAEIHHFRSDDDRDKDFWIDELAGIKDDEALFSYAQEVKANVPYIVAFPGDKWGAERSFKDKTVVFHGSNAHFETGARSVASTDTYVMRGSMTKKNLTDAYTMNAAGDAFVLDGQDEVAPFRAYFTMKQETTTSPRMLRIVTNGTSTGIDAVKSGCEKVAVYSLSGMKMGVATLVDGRPEGLRLSPGVYIVKGRKWVVR